MREKADPYSPSSLLDASQRSPLQAVSRRMGDRHQIDTAASHAGVGGIIPNT